jgi:S1-C subfamily serine protease
VGDRLLAVGDAKIKSVQEAQNAVRDTRSKGRTAVLVQIERDGAKLFLGVPLTNP